MMESGKWKVENCDFLESTNEVPVKQAKRFLQSKNVSCKTSEALFAKQKCFL